LKLYFARHGESEANLLGEFSNTGTKHPLTPKGVAQAHALAGLLAPQQIAKIYTSPILRAVETATILAQALNATIETTEALREWSVGVLEGTRDAAGWGMHRQVQEDWFLHQRLESKIPEGESFVEIQERFAPFIAQLVERGRSLDEQILLIGHGGLYIAMLPAIVRNLPAAFAFSHGFPNTAYALVETRPDGLYCVEWCGMAVAS
jgi:broad specificity phosphatase PhoE